ncbi:hypothetical protein NLG97_g6289 [Lecanicillium saksenae]|uniref:Uncharacterized protein n=1 Tax=Lecanicillium saksenae TaxID=468837 RepID=A0ACC1QSE8_9HYPO|nr:hypothetical protein NLG97_g6289 [Lecanicillium saksenae]
MSSPVLDDTGKVLLALPSCAFDCWLPAFNSVYCHITPKLCDCRPGDADNIRDAVSPCLKERCSTDDANKGLKIFPSICWNGSGDGKAPSSSSAGSSTSTSTGTSTPDSSSTDGAKATNSTPKNGVPSFEATGVSNPQATSTNDSNSSGGGLSAGEKATIGVGALLGATLILVIIAWAFRHRRKRMGSKNDNQGSETSKGPVEEKATETAPRSRQGVAELEGNPVSEVGGHPIAELP